MPKIVPSIILYDATFVTNRIIAAIPIAIIDVSPTEPGMCPKKASNHVKLSVNPLKPSSAA